ncbi:Folylpolyglutamate synthetase [Diaporthe eres]|uniref:Folylpolyglutamate synthase n=1 Tax=Diaporthe eres TaxID=83184 RepID=A0ABR1NPN1_DIAER
MSSSTAPGRTYEDAIDALNTFQTPFAVIEARRKAGIRPDESSVREMKAYWARLGHTPEDLDRLNVVHVAGTKGKGSVCAFVASILGRYERRGSGLKVGLLTSPHLVAVRERIRVGSAPLSEASFARYFFEVSDALTDPAPGGTSSLLPDDAEPGSRPIYARYLTLMALHVFLREGVDVAVVETGVGGEYDATNIVARPAAAGISTLGIDHVFVLGDTVDKIAWHKAGIMKAGSPAFAVEQPAFPSAEGVLRARAAEKGVDLRVLGVDARLAASGVAVRPDAAFQRRNASLAVALAEAALARVDTEGFRRDGGRLPAEFKDGIEQVVWRGRCEVKEEEGGRLRWHIDGAHTTDSLKMAARWFAGANEGRRGPRILIFNQQGRTEAIDFLDGLHSGAKRDDGSSFDHVVFCTNVTHATTGYKRDFVNHQYDPEAIKKLTVQRTFAERWSSLDPRAKITVIPSIEEAINVARDLTSSLEEGETVQAFITGSLHLVGGALGILEGADAL